VKNRSIDSLTLENKYINLLIVATPSGKWRNKLTERHIRIALLLKKKFEVKT
jgi:hypothetical protein